MEQSEEIKFLSSIFMPIRRLNYTIKYPDGSIDVCSSCGSFNEKIKQLRKENKNSSVKLEDLGYKFMRVHIQDKEEIKEFKNVIIAKIAEDEDVFNGLMRIIGGELSSVMYLASEMEFSENTNINKKLIPENNENKK